MDGDAAAPGPRGDEEAADPTGGRPVVRVRAVARGRVQGVWYRQSCLERARELGVAGWVRNRPDGTVEAEVEGPGDAVEALVAWMEEGPPLAVVVGVDHTDLPPVGSTGFEVR